METPETPETPLEVADRHVREGEERIAKQRALIAELERDQHGQLLPGARELLAQLEASQRLVREHQQHEQRHAASVAQTPAAG